MERISRRRRFSVFSGRSVTWLAEVFASPQRRFFPPSLLFKGERSEGNNVVSRENSQGFFGRLLPEADNFVFDEFCGKELDRLRFWPTFRGDGLAFW